MLEDTTSKELANRMSFIVPPLTVQPVFPAQPEPEDHRERQRMLVLLDAFRL